MLEITPGVQGLPCPHPNVKQTLHSSIIFNYTQIRPLRADAVMLQAKLATHLIQHFDFAYVRCISVFHSGGFFIKWTLTP